LLSVSNASRRKSSQRVKLAEEEHVESVEQENAKINGLEGQTVQNKE
jgi:hypothetical protein